jgi:hypothetical protein
MKQITQEVKEAVADVILQNSLWHESNDNTYTRIVESLVKSDIIDANDEDVLKYIKSVVYNEDEEADEYELTSLDNIVDNLVKALEIDDYDDDDDDDDLDNFNDEGDDDLRYAEEDEWREDFNGRGFNKYQLEDEENYELSYDGNEDC